MTVPKFQFITLELSPCNNYWPVTIFWLCPEVVTISDKHCTTMGMVDKGIAWFEIMLLVSKTHVKLFTCNDFYFPWHKITCYFMYAIRDRNIQVDTHFWPNWTNLDSGRYSWLWLCNESQECERNEWAWISGPHVRHGRDPDLPPLWQPSQQVRYIRYKL